MKQAFDVTLESFVCCGFELHLQKSALEEEETIISLL